VRGLCEPRNSRFTDARSGPRELRATRRHSGADESSVPRHAGERRRVRRARGRRRVAGSIGRSPAPITYHGDPTVHRVHLVGVQWGAGTYLPGVTSATAPNVKNFASTLVQSPRRSCRAVDPAWPDDAGIDREGAPPSCCAHVEYNAPRRAFGSYGRGARTRGRYRHVAHALTVTRTARRAPSVLRARSAELRRRASLLLR
jgi:hypothetical protein